MAAPSATARGTPAGIDLSDGHPTKLTCAANTTVSFWERTVKPPGVDGGDPIDQTTMHNVAWRVRRPRHLKTLMEVTGEAGYDPNVLSQILSVVNVETTWTVTFPDGSTDAFYGFLQKFEPQDCKEGEKPMANFTVCPTNYDPSGHVEAGPTLTSVAGT